MTTTIIQQRLLNYQCKNVHEQENALKEIMQEIVLMSLAKTDFFRKAAFQGGTCLRILHGLERFSEDMSFSLKTPAYHFQWSDYLRSLTADFQSYGFALEITSTKRSHYSSIFMIKSLKNHLPVIRLPIHLQTFSSKEAQYECQYLKFPLSHGIISYDLPSLFAFDCHHLLTQHEILGRNWFDFAWHVGRQTSLNLNLLSNATAQSGPWQGRSIKVKPSWILQTLEHKIKDTDWDAAKQDIVRFLQPKDVIALDVWSEAFFLSRLDKLATYLM